MTSHRHNQQTVQSRYPMSCGALVLLAMAGCLLLTSIAEAQPRQRGLLLLGGLSQNIATQYDYQDQSSTSQGQTIESSQHTFTEDYSMRFRYAFYNPRILNGIFSGTAQLTQDVANSTTTQTRSSSDADFRYHLSGKFLDKKPYPVNFYSFSELNRVQNRFAPTYSIQSNGYGASTGVKNKYFPFGLTYSHNTTNSTGSSNGEISSENDSASFSTSHSRGISNTGLMTSRTNSRISGQTPSVSSVAETYNFKANNTLSWASPTGRQRYSLLSRYTVSNEMGTAPRKLRELSEDLELRPGKAIFLQGSYKLEQDEDLFDTVTTESASGQISHTLYSNLNTSLSGHTSTTEFKIGSATTSGGKLALNYTKILPQTSALSLGYSYAFATIDQLYTATTLLITNEEHVVPPDLIFPAYEFRLDNIDIIHDTAGSILVTNEARTFRYLEGLHYTVRQEGLWTYVLLTQVPLAGAFPIDPGSKLLISYRKLVNKSLQFNNITHSATGSLSLFSGHYIFAANMSQSGNQIIRGSDTIGQTSEVSSLTLSATVREERTMYGATYNHFTGSDTTADAWSAFWNYNRQTDYGHLTMNASERYGTSSAVSGKTSWSNSFRYRADLQRSLLRRFNMKLNGSYVNQLDPDTTSNELSLGLSMAAGFGKSNISLATASAWRFMENYTSRTTSVHLLFNRQL